MAVSSANRTGRPPADHLRRGGRAARRGRSSVYLDGGPSGEPVPSTIVDVTGATPRVLRLGAVDAEALPTVAPDLVAEPYSDGS